MMILLRSRHPTSSQPHQAVAGNRGASWKESPRSVADYWKGHMGVSIVMGVPKIPKIDGLCRKKLLKLMIYIVVPIFEETSKLCLTLRNDEQPFDKQQAVDTPRGNHKNCVFPSVMLGISLLNILESCFFEHCGGCDIEIFG